MPLWFASGNIHKKKELAEILQSAAPKELELKIPSEAGIAFDPEETGSSFLENALIKAVELHRLLGEKGLLRPGDAVIADDSGICADALGGRPGIHSAYYGMGTRDWGTGNNNASPQSPVPNPQSPFPSPHSPKLTASEQNALLLAELGDTPQRGGRFVCCMVLYYSADRFFVAQETFEGELVKEMRGEGGFGYDPIFYLPEFGKTMAEISEAEKNRISHRGKAGKIIAGLMNVL